MDRYNLYYKDGLWVLYRANDLKLIRSGNTKGEMVSYARSLVIRNDCFVVIQKRN